VREVGGVGGLLLFEARWNEISKDIVTPPSDFVFLLMKLTGLVAWHAVP
jgi:hypothetical protein